LYIAHVASRDVQKKNEIDESTFERGLDYVLSVLKQEGCIGGPEDIGVVGIRVVAPGTFFQQHRVIDSGYIDALKKVSLLAPEHIENTSKIIASISETFPTAQIVGLSDSAFHAQMPEVSREYAISSADAEQYDIYRYGYHGFSVGSIAAQMGDTVPEKMIICHLGGGVSMTALRNGKTVDTTMGFSPTEGLCMSSRVGAIDPTALLYLMGQKGMSIADTQKYITRESGMRGLSGITGDMRELIHLRDLGDARATLTIKLFVQKIKKQLGAYIALLNGVSCIVFTGTIGERSFVIRSEICADLDALGIAIDSKQNSVIDGVGVTSGTISSGAVTVLVMPTDEMGQMARELIQLGK
jgi:acetate kinase